MTTPFQAPASDYLAPFYGSFQIGDFPCRDDASPGKGEARERLDAARERIVDAQRRLYAQDTWSVLLVFQAMDAAGKDSTIRHVLSGVNPAGCQVSSFKKPSTKELGHDFLWRHACALPSRGQIGVFNRSHYEEVLVVRVHPKILGYQKLPFETDLDDIWPQRLESINDHERHLARNGTAILKFFLNVSHKEQRERFLARLETPHKRWKFEPGDVRERAHWDAYQRAYDEAIRETSKPWAPWYAIPADSKPAMRCHVAEIVADALDSLELRYPQTGASDQAVHDELHQALLAET